MANSAETPPNWQTRAAKFASDHNLTRSASVYALDTMSELGEVAKALLLTTNYGDHAPTANDELAGELGDLVYSICMLASAVEIDLEQAFSAALNKYTERIRAKGHSGSQS